MIDRILIPVVSCLAASMGSAQCDEDKHDHVWYVDDSAPASGDGTSWTAPFVDLQAALTAAGNSMGTDEIRVAQGTYVPTLRTNPADPRSVTFRVTNTHNGLAIRGGYQGYGPGNPDHRQPRHLSPARFVTVLSGDINGNDLPGFGNNGENAYHVVSLDPGFNGSVSSVELNGLKIVGGNANVDTATDGGGLLTVGTDVDLVRCTFVGNYARNGGAVSMGPSLNGSNVDAVDCAFLGNAAQNTAGAFRVRAVEARFLNCLFSGNSVGDVDHVGNGGALWVANLFAFDYGPFRLVNCTLAQNTAPFGSGGAVFAQTGGPHTSTIDNSIVWQNSPNQIGGVIGGAQAITVRYTNIQGGWTGPGSNNINQSPAFLSAAGGDGIPGSIDDNLRLEATSTSIGAANPSLAIIEEDCPWDADDDGDTIELTPDHDMTERVVPTGVDMGCYECAEQEACAADLDDNGEVRIEDLLQLLAEWGSPPPHTADIAPDCGDGDVGSPDLLELLATWGLCPLGLQASGGDTPRTGRASWTAARASELRLGLSLSLMGFDGADAYRAWLAGATDEDAQVSAVLLATLLWEGRR